jgi:hypothetical protein
MSTKVSRNGNRVRITEYEVREITADGDAVDVHHFDTKDEAKREAARYAQALPVNEVVAVAVEKHVSKHPHNGEADVYETLATYGSPDALSAWRGGASE